MSKEIFQKSTKKRYHLKFEYIGKIQYIVCIKNENSNELVCYKKK